MAQIILNNAGKNLRVSHYFFTDCTAPFQLAIVTDAMTDTPDATTVNKQQSRGINTAFLQFTQPD